MENGYIVIIGGINADITGKAVKDVVRNESNIGKVTLTSGGVARNICENLVRLGVSCEFITTFSDDHLADMLKTSCAELGISTKYSYGTKEYSTGTYLSLEDHTGEMVAAVCDLSAIMNMPLSHIDKCNEVIVNATCIVIDCNLSKPMIEYIADKYRDKIIIAEAVSSAKVIKLKKCLSDIHTVKLNRQEFSALYGVEYTVDNGKRMSKKYKNRIFVTEGADGSTGYENDQVVHVDAIDVKKIVSVNGAGDSYAAGLAYGIKKGYDTLHCMRLGSIMSFITLSSPGAVSKDITERKILKMLKETGKND